MITNDVKAYRDYLKRKYLSGSEEQLKEAISYQQREIEKREYELIHLEKRLKFLKEIQHTRKINKRNANISRSALVNRLVRRK